MIVFLSALFGSHLYSCTNVCSLACGLIDDHRYIQWQGYVSDVAGCRQIQTYHQKKWQMRLQRLENTLSSFLSRHSRDNKGPPAISIYSFQGGGGCNDRHWWSAGLNGISLLSPVSNVMAVLESRPTVSDWGYKGKEICASLNEITIHGSCQGTSHLTSCWGAGQE